MELFSLKDKVIVITGASGLLGKEYAESIANYKGIPILVDINAKELDKQVKEINKTFNIKSEAYSIDITDEKSVKNCCEAIKNKFGKIDGLINNASNNPQVESSKKNFSRLEKFSLKSWQEDISVTVKKILKLVLSLIPRILQYLMLLGESVSIRQVHPLI